MSLENKENVNKLLLILEQDTFKIETVHLQLIVFDLVIILSPVFVSGAYSWVQRI